MCLYIQQFFYDSVEHDIFLVSIRLLSLCRTFQKYLLCISPKIWTAFSILVCSISQLGRLARTRLAPAVTVNTGMLRYLLLCYSSLCLTAQCTSLHKSNCSAVLTVHCLQTVPYLHFLVSTLKHKFSGQAEIGRLRESKIGRRRGCENFSSFLPPHICWRGHFAAWLTRSHQWHI